MKMAALASAIALALSAAPGATARLDVRLIIPASAEARSAVFEIAASDELSVRLDQAATSADGTVRVYVFDADGVLRGLDDPDSSAEEFVWHPPARGRYFVKAVNTNSSAVALRIAADRSRGISIQALQNYATVRVFFATNRQRSRDAAIAFGPDPADDISYGTCTVSIPRDHRMGELEAPSIWRLEVREDPQKHVVITATEDRSARDFFGRVADRVALSRQREALVFVHGFNVSFADAVKRTAQIAYDLGFDGPAIAFSWPSQGSVAPTAYIKDQRNADVSAEALREFLLRLKGASDRVTIHVIAHSMGNRVLARALEQVASDGRRTRTPPLTEVAMMAPDVDAALFRQAAGKIAASAEHVTLYASSGDVALLAAQRIAGYPRAGQAGDGLVVVSGIDTVDASTVDTSVLGVGHAYYSDNATILSDLFDLIRGRRPDERFRLKRVQASAGTYWQFRPAAR